MPVLWLCVLDAMEDAIEEAVVCVLDAMEDAIEEAVVRYVLVLFRRATAEALGRARPKSVI